MKASQLIVLFALMTFCIGDKQKSTWVNDFPLLCMSRSDCEGVNQMCVRATPHSSFGHCVLKESKPSGQHRNNHVKKRVSRHVGRMDGSPRKRKRGTGKVGSRSEHDIKLRRDINPDQDLYRVADRRRTSTRKDPSEEEDLKNVAVLSDIKPGMKSVPTTEMLRHLYRFPVNRTVVYTVEDRENREEDDENNDEDEEEDEREKNVRKIMETAQSEINEIKNPIYNIDENSELYEALEYGDLDDDDDDDDDDDSLEKEPISHPNKHDDDISDDEEETVDVGVSMFNISAGTVPAFDAGVSMVKVSDHENELTDVGVSIVNVTGKEIWTNDVGESMADISDNDNETNDVGVSMIDVSDIKNEASDVGVSMFNVAGDENETDDFKESMVDVSDDDINPTDFDISMADVSEDSYTTDLNKLKENIIESVTEQETENDQRPLMATIRYSKGNTKKLNINDISTLQNVKRSKITDKLTVIKSPKKDEDDLEKRTGIESTVELLENTIQEKLKSSRNTKKQMGTVKELINDLITKNEEQETIKESNEDEVNDELAILIENKIYKKKLNADKVMAEIVFRKLKDAKKKDQQIDELAKIVSKQLKTKHESMSEDKENVFNLLEKMIQRNSLKRNQDKNVKDDSHDLTKIKDIIKRMNIQIGRKVPKIETIEELLENIIQRRLKSEPRKRIRQIRTERESNFDIVKRFRARQKLKKHVKKNVLELLNLLLLQEDIIKERRSVVKQIKAQQEVNADPVKILRARQKLQKHVKESILKLLKQLIPVERNSKEKRSTLKQINDPEESRNVFQKPNSLAKPIQRNMKHSKNRKIKQSKG